MKKIAVTVLLASLLLNVVGCSSSSEVATSGEGSEASYTFKMATDASNDYPTTQALYVFADEVEAKTDGRITIDVYPSAQLGDETSYLQQLQFGTVDFAKSSVASLAAFCDELNALSLPYLFDSTDHMFRCLNGEIGEEIFAEFEASNIVGLGYTDNGSRNFFTTTPVTQVSDMKNLTIRVQYSSVMNGLVENLGAFPINIASTEVYSGLQTGVVQGAENNINTYYADSLYEQASYYILDQHNIQPEIIVASKQVWDTLSEEDQEIIQEAMDYAMEVQRELWAESELESETELLEHGVTIYEPTEAELQEFRESCEPLYSDPELGAPYEEFVAKIRAVQ